jgi:predicted secreted protein
MTYRIAVGALALALVAGAAGADDDAGRNRISFGVERTREVENDWVTAVIGATHEDADPARLADKINTDVAWGLEIAKAVPGLRVRTGGYRTYPIDDPTRGGLRRWRGGQDLVIEGKDARAASELLGRLQARLQLQDLQFSVSPERRRSVEDELIGEALDAFRARAEQIRARMKASGYTLVHVSVDTFGGPQPMPGRVAMMEMAARDVAPPPLEGGTSTLRVGASGTIELGGL